MKQYTAAPDFVIDIRSKTDWPLFRRQKATLVELKKELKGTNRADDIAGIIHFLDAVQDWIVDHDLGTEEEIHGPHSKP